MSKKIWSNYSKRLDLIDDQFERFDLKYKNIPLNENAVKQLAQTRLLYHEVSAAYENENAAYLKENLSTLENNLTQLISQAETTMADFFKDAALFFFLAFSASAIPLGV